MDLKRYFVVALLASCGCTGEHNEIEDVPVTPRVAFVSSEIEWAVLVRDTLREADADGDALFSRNDSAYVKFYAANQSATSITCEVSGTFPKYNAFEFAISNDSEVIATVKAPSNTGGLVPFGVTSETLLEIAPGSRFTTETAFTKVLVGLKAGTYSIAPTFRLMCGESEQPQVSLRFKVQE